jgi:ribosome-associated protein
VIATVAGMRDVAISGDMIRLGQLLKLAGVIGAGAEVKPLLAQQPPRVLVNGEPETRRGRQLHPGDVIAVSGAGEPLRLVGETG